MNVFSFQIIVLFNSLFGFYTLAFGHTFSKETNTGNTRSILHVSRNEEGLGN